MVILNKLTWSNCFSYGSNNTINFTKAPLLQLVGKNGHGKSSVALILEEVLYNKNSKGIKKADILNRYVKETGYHIELIFTKDADEYKIESRRQGQQVVRLFKNGKDVSGHTATTTYKAIESIIGIDHKTFTQVVYQSHAGSLEFLTSADTARKKFLIELLNLGKYTETGDVFKKLAQDLTTLVASAETKVKTTQDWINKYSAQNLDPKPILHIPQVPQELNVEAQTLEQQLQTIGQQNKKITQNNTYKRLQDSIQLFPVPLKPTKTTTPLVVARAELDKSGKDAEAFIKKMQNLGAQCPTCLQAIDISKTKQLLEEQQAIVLASRVESKALAEQIAKINQELRDWEQAVKAQEEWEKYYQLIDADVPDTPLDEKDLTRRLGIVQQELGKFRDEIQRIQRDNELRLQHNSRAETIRQQLQEMNADLTTWSANLASLTKRLGIVNILVKTFSTTGLVAYKIENLVKDLETLTNEYLGELSGGRFQISFEIAGNDKLNVVIVDNGSSIDIQALSGGERARVNVATLLAIRKLMQSLSQNRINLLILDETVETLDLDGKEKLVEVLLAEENLNTVLVSHGFSHPLLEKVGVVKRQNISRIEE